MKRFEPLDIFRGMTICFMIIVNTPGDWGDTYSMLLHAKWHGFTPTDLVFPSFLFAVGNAMAFVSLKWEGKPAQQVLLRGLKRAALIFLIGYLLYWFPFFRIVDGEMVAKSIGTTRIFGVLQRIGLCYAIALPFVYYLDTRKIIYASVAMLFSYWGLMVLFGDLSLEGNAALRLDLWLIGADHMYRGEGIPFDPEGLLSTIPSVVNIFGGYLLGVYLRDGEFNWEKMGKILLVGTALCFIGFLWHFSFPINKKIWTSSFVLLTVGLDFVIIAIIIYLMQFSPRKFTFRFFNTFGKNPLFIYLLSGVLATLLWMLRIGGSSAYSWIYQNVFAWIGGHLGSFAFAITFMLVCWAVGKWLENRNIYIKI